MFIDGSKTRELKLYWHFINASHSSHFLLLLLLFLKFWTQWHSWEGVCPVKVSTQTPYFTSTCSVT